MTVATPLLVSSRSAQRADSRQRHGTINALPRRVGLAKEAYTISSVHIYQNRIDLTYLSWVADREATLLYDTSRESFTSIDL